MASHKYQKQEYDSNAGERVENAQFRTLMMRFKDQSLGEAQHVSQQWSRHLRRDFLDGLSSYNDVTSWKQARSKGCVKWILENEQYRQWNTTFNSTLWLVGNLGSGKTIVAASVIADLAIQEQQTSLCYFFCRFDDAESLKAKTVISNLAKQLLLGVEFRMPMPTSSAADVDDVIELLLTTFKYQAPKKKIVCLDGIDECDASERDQILSALKRLCHAPESKFRVFLSIRRSSQLAIQRLLPPDETISMSHANRNDEIAAYVKSTLIQHIERRELVLGDPSLIARIANELSIKANGMYLWVYLQLQAICEQTTDYDIIQTLDNLPEDLHKTYARILSRLNQHSGLSVKLFETITSCKRPLSTEELREVLAIGIGELELKVGGLVNDISKTVAQCGGSLFVIDEEDFTVYFVHESFRQFLTNDIEKQSEISRYCIDNEKADLNLGLRCVTYLNMGVYDPQLTKVKDLTPWNGVAPDKIIRTTFADTGITTKLALKYLKSSQGQGQGISPNIAVQLERVAALRDRTAKLTFAFLPYAKAHVFTHTKHLLGCDSDLDSLFFNTFNGHLSFVTTPWTSDVPRWKVSRDDEALSSNAISWAVDHDHFGLLYRALRIHDVSKTVKGPTGETRKFSVPEETVLQFFNLGFARQRIQVVMFLVRTLCIDESSTVGWWLLFPIIAHTRGVIGEWMKQEGCRKWLDDLTAVDRLELINYGVNIRSKAMRLWQSPRNAVYYIEIYEDDCYWDIYALAAACNNIPAIEAIEKSDNFRNLSRHRIAKIFLHGLREAAARGYVAMAKHLISSFCARVRDDEIMVTPDEYCWTPLHYAAALGDSITYARFFPLYSHRYGNESPFYFETTYGIPHLELVVQIAKRPFLELDIVEELDAAEKEKIAEKGEKAEKDNVTEEEGVAERETMATSIKHRKVPFWRRTLDDSKILIPDNSSETSKSSLDGSKRPDRPPFEKISKEASNYKDSKIWERWRKFLASRRSANTNTIDGSVGDYPSRSPKIDTPLPTESRESFYAPPEVGSEKATPVDELLDAVTSRTSTQASHSLKKPETLYSTILDRALPNFQRPDSSNGSGAVEFHAPTSETDHMPDQAVSPFILADDEAEPNEDPANIMSVLVNGDPTDVSTQRHPDCERSCATNPDPVTPTSLPQRKIAASTMTSLDQVRLTFQRIDSSIEKIIVELRARKLRTDETPAHITSGSVMGDEKIEATDAGSNAVVAKTPS